MRWARGGFGPVTTSGVLVAVLALVTATGVLWRWWNGPDE